MTSDSARANGSLDSTAARQTPIAARQFMITLCRLAAPVSIRPPQSPQLKRFTFFKSRTRHRDGSERLYLNMGYFETLAEAERWVFVVRRRYPSAFATPAPVDLMPPADSSAPSLPDPTVSESIVLEGDGSAPSHDKSLTDTQALRILEARRSPGVEDEGDSSDCDQIELLRPEDTSTRRALTAAVVAGAPVSFAVQLKWSGEPIDLSHLPSLAIFKSHTVYAIETRHEGHSRHFLRLGFFENPMSAKRAAVQVRSSFAAAAVVPVAEQEVWRARKARLESSTIPNLVEDRVDQHSNLGGAPESPRPSKSSTDTTQRTAQGAGSAASKSTAPGDTDMWTASDSLSTTGVRHLRIEVQEQTTGRWKAIRLAPTPSNEKPVYS